MLPDDLPHVLEAVPATFADAPGDAPQEGEVQRIEVALQRSWHSALDRRADSLTPVRHDGQTHVIHQAIGEVDAGDVAPLPEIVIEGIAPDLRQDGVRQIRSLLEPLA